MWIEKSVKPWENGPKKPTFGDWQGSGRDGEVEEAPSGKLMVEEVGRARRMNSWESRTRASGRLGKWAGPLGGTERSRWEELRMKVQESDNWEVGGA